MMIGAKNIDQIFKSTMNLVLMIGNVGAKIRLVAILFDDHPVLLVLKSRGFQPYGAILVIYESFFPQPPQSVVNGVIVVKRLFAEPAVKLDPEFPEIGFDTVQNPFGRKLSEKGKRVFIGLF